jgi:hypothetical protein
MHSDGPPSPPHPPPRNAHTGPVTKTRASFERELLDWDFLKAWEDETAPSAKAPAPKDDNGLGGGGGGHDDDDDDEAEEEEGEITADDGGGGGKVEEVKEVKEERWTPVPDTFSSAAQYVDVWFPLLLQEMRAETLSEVTTEGLGAFSKVRARRREAFGNVAVTLAFNHTESC